jgi:hypothetical protein
MRCLVNHVLANKPRYNSVVFETIAANDVDFAIVHPSFFTDPDSWQRRNDTDRDYSDRYNNQISQLQALVLDDRYLDRNLFDNLTNAECQAQYSATFITNGGTAFGVPTPKTMETVYLSANSSLHVVYGGSGDLRINRENADPGTDSKNYYACESNAAGKF